MPAENSDNDLKLIAEITIPQNWEREKKNKPDNETFLKYKKYCENNFNGNLFRIDLTDRNKFF